MAYSVDRLVSCASQLNENKIDDGWPPAPPRLPRIQQWDLACFGAALGQQKLGSKLGFLTHRQRVKEYFTLSPPKNTPAECKVLFFNPPPPGREHLNQGPRALTRLAHARPPGSTAKPPSGSGTHRRRLDCAWSHTAWSAGGGSQTANRHPPLPRYPENLDGHPSRQQNMIRAPNLLGNIGRSKW